MKRALLILFVVVAFAGCTTTPTEISEDLSQAELIQLAQESADNDNWEAAQAYYQAILDRFPQDREAVVTAHYEIAFAHYKLGNYEEARAGFEAVLGLYDFEGDVLPEWPRVLSERLIEELDAERNSSDTEEAS